MIALARHDPIADWRSILEVLAASPEYDRRLDALLERASDLIGLPACYLYVLDESGRRFRLERGRNVSRAPQHAHRGDEVPSEGPTEPGAPPSGTLLPSATSGAAPAKEVGDSFQMTDEGGAGAVVPTPPLELPLAGGPETAAIVATPVGDLYSVPLRLDGELVGLLQAGPLRGGAPAGRVRRRLESVELPLAVVSRQLRVEERLRQQASAAAARLDAGHKLVGSSLDLDRFVSLLLDLALKASRSDAGFVATVDAESGELAVRSDQNMKPGFAEDIDLSPDTGLFDWSLSFDGGTLFIRDLEAAERLGARSILAVPLLHGGEPVGVFALVNFGDTETFAEHSLELLATFSDQIRLMLGNTRLFKTFAGQYLESVKSLARSLDVRRPHLHGHHRKVSWVAAAIAREAGLSAGEREAVTTAGLIHDVDMAGLVGSDVGADLEHPTVGASLVEHLPLHPAIAESVATHHEWFDGWGFPKGSKGESIPEAGRVLALAEFLVEMAIGDPVRDPWSAARLAAELHQRRGSQFDPSLTDTAIDLTPAIVAGIATATNGEAQEG